MSSNLHMIDCAFCGYDIPLYHSEINLAVCPSCNNVCRLMDRTSLKYTQYDVAEKLRLSKDLENLKISVEDHFEKNVIGINVLDYNEALLYFFFTSSPDLKTVVFFEYQWYELVDAKKTINKLNISNIESGEYFKIFNDGNSYVINIESGRESSFAGQVKIPIHKVKNHIVEHSINDNLYFSFFDESIHLNSFLLKAISSVKLNKEILHRTIEHNCNACKKTIKIENFPFSKSFACECGNSFYIEKFGDIHFLKKNNKGHVPFIKINSKCILDEIVYTVTGHVKKQDTNGYSWDEFTLWNIEKGFLYLSVYNGNWIKLTIVKLKTHIATNRSKLQKYIYEDEQEYSIYNDYRSSINECTGTFAGNILNDKDYVGIEYIAPPTMWAFEKPQKESITAFKGEHIDGKQLKEAFDGNIELPIKREMGALEPRKGTMNIQLMMANFVFGFLLLLATQIFTNFLNRDRIVYQGSGDNYVVDSLKNRLVTPPFEIQKSHSNLSIKLDAPIDNSWLENEIEVINLSNGESINTEQGIEYYSGYEGGESWSEGDRENELILSYLPKGKYQVSFTPTSDKPTNYNITITEDVNMYKNFWLILLFLTIPSVLYAIYNYNTEVTRWSNSIYNPYLPHE